MRYGVHIAPFGALAEPRVVADLAGEAEAAGWDGFFLWDHIQYRPAELPVADPWITLSAVAVQTRRIRLGALVTPLARRRPHVFARQTATLDVLSRGRLVVGAALGRDRSRELSAFAEELDDRRRAAMLDEGLALVEQLWSGQDVHHRGAHHVAQSVRFLPAPPQQPRIPVWIGGRGTARRPLERAARWDGYFPVDVPSPGDLAQIAARLAEVRGTLDGFDLVVAGEPGTDPAPWGEVGATWWLVAFPPIASPEAVRLIIRRGPG